MKWWDKVKSFFRKEADYLAGKELTTIFDHDKVAFDSKEYDRIRDSFKFYAGEYDKVKYLNSNRELKERDYFHLNMMKEVTRTLADVMVNEDAEIIVISEDSEVNKFVQSVFDDTKFIRNLKRYIEPMLATGGLSVKPYFDVDEQKIDFSWSLADTFIPLRYNTNGISECVIPSVTTEVIDDKKVYYTLLEFHEWQEDGYYTITNELYKSDKKGKIGKRVRLNELYDDLEEVTTYNLFTRPNFSYLQPSGFNNINPESPLGLGICDNAKTTLQQINDTYDEFHWEIKQGKRRFLVSDHLTKVRFDENGRPIQYFDSDTDVFVPIRGEMDDVKHQDLTVSIRATEYITSINKFFATLEMQTGLSSGTFTFDGESVKTATEVVSRDSTTYRTRNSHLNNVEQFVKNLIISTIELARETFGADGHPLFSGVTPTEKDITVSFDDGVFESRSSELDFWGRAKMLGLASTQTALIKAFKLTEEEAEKEFNRIKVEQTLIDPYEQGKIAESTLLGGME